MTLIDIIIGLVLGGGAFAASSGLIGGGKGDGLADVETRKKKMDADVEIEKAEIMSEAKKQRDQEMERSEENIGLLKKQLERDEHSIANKEKQLKEKEEKLSGLKNEIDSIKQEVADSEKGIEETKEQMVEALLKKRGASFDEVKKQIAEDIDRGMVYRGETMMQKREESLREDLEKNAKMVIMEAIQKYAKESSVEKRYAVIAVPRDNVKGKIVGENGKNILFFEEQTEAEVIFNDAPNTIIVSHYNLLRQKIAYIAMKKLIKEKEVNEEVITRVLEQAEKEIDGQLLEIGKEAAKKMELEGYPDDFYKLIGRLRFRTSFGQNILSHSFEVAAFGRMLAGEIGSDIREAELACFFHDIGKAIDQDVNKPHDILSKEILEKYGFPEEIVHAAHAHHDAVPQVRPVDYIVMAADAISAGRPGARAETLEKYLEKIRALEGIATSKQGVEKAFAISAGREVRVLVNAEKVTDDSAKGVAHDIAKEIEENVIYPGKIKVNVIRRTESVDYANRKSKK